MNNNNNLITFNEIFTLNWITCQLILWIEKQET